MTVLKRTFAILSVITTILATSGCSSLSPADQHSRIDRVSLSEAEEIVRNLIFSKVPGMNPSTKFPLKEFTTDEVWQRMGAQIFQVTGDFYWHETYLIKGGRAFDLGMVDWLDVSPESPSGLTSMCVADLDRSGKPELIYIHTGGSGLHYSYLASFSEDSLDPDGIESIMLYMDYDLMLEKVDDQNVTVKVAYYDWPQKKWKVLSPLGQVIVEQRDGGVRPVVKLFDALPQSITDRIVKR